MLTATKRMKFCYGHTLVGYDGKCARMHGHNAVLEVTVKGGPSPDGAGSEYYQLLSERYPKMVLDFAILKEAIQKEVIDILDHQFLNPIIGYHPTAEKTAVWIWWRLSEVFGSSLVEIRLSETDDSWVTLTAGDVTDALIYNYFREGNKNDT